MSRLANKKSNYKDIAKSIVNDVLIQDESAHKRLSDQIDPYIAHPLVGLFLFAFIMWLVFSISQIWFGPIISDLLSSLMTVITIQIDHFFELIGVSELLRRFIAEGIIGGFAALLGFLPLIMILYFFLQLLEDSGYMARVAMLMDKYFRRIGLSGKSIIPMYVGTACSIPAVMSARTIKNERQRRLTVLLTPFVPCGAKLPVIALFLTVFFNGKSYMTVIVYMMALLIIFVTGVILKHLLNITNKHITEDSFLFVELPDYKFPSLKQAFISMLDNGWSFIVKAGTIIVLANSIVWLTINFDFTFHVVAHIDESILATLSRPLSFLLSPIGIASWGLAAAAILGLIAKEEVVGALAVIYAFSVTDDFSAESLDATRNALMVGANMTAVSAFAYTAFNLFTPPCFAAIGAMNSELKSRRWTVFAVLLHLTIGFLSAMIIYQVGHILTTGEVGQSFVASIMILSVFVIIFFYLKQLAKQGKGLAKIG